MKRKNLNDLAINVHRDPGDALAGEKIIAHARRVGKPMIVSGTSKHKMQEITLKVNALCVIDRPFQLTDLAMKITGIK